MIRSTKEEREQQAYADHLRAITKQLEDLDEEPDWATDEVNDRVRDSITLLTEAWKAVEDWEPDTDDTDAEPEDDSDAPA